LLTSEETLTIGQPERRVVQQVTQGRFAGIYRIIGRVSDMVPDPVSPKVGTQLPTYVDKAHLIDHFGPMSLVKLTSRYVLYREMLPPPPTGILNEFHPQQR
jgi:hypothetical protein